MEKKINIVELIKDCPKGMELDCAMYNKVTLLSVDDSEDIIFPIKVMREDGNTLLLTKYGQYSGVDFAKCIIFPKGKTTWEGFHRPFKDGDVITSLNTSIYIFTEHNGYFFSPCGLIANHECKNHYFKVCDISISPDNMRLATEEEKQKLFDSIKENGYRWNAENKTLEKLIEPKFKVDDKIKLKGGDEFGIITEVADCFYKIKCKNNTHCWPIKKQDDWELIPNKFDITTLKPFESKVLVRSANGDVWRPAIYGFANSDRYYIVGGVFWEQCIPYEGNEHLLGTTDNCNEYYKTW